MKKFNNNFTTLKQSKRLLELGVPADSADCFYKLNNFGYIIMPTPRIISYLLDDVNGMDWNSAKAIPCWSVGRLIEIMKICSNGVATWYLRSIDKEPLIEQWIDFLESGLFEKDFDFSKLEE